MELLQLIYDFLFYSAVPDGVNIALGPLAIAGITLGTQIVGQGISKLMNRGERRRQRRRANRAEDRQESSLQRLNQSVQNVRSQSEQAGDLATRTDDELFGEERARRTRDVRDTIGQQAAGARQAVSRALLSGGGDVTGSGGITLNRLQERANSNIAQALSQIENEISRRGQQERRYQQGRSDQLLSRALGAESSQFGALSGQAQNAELLRIQQQQAERQMGADIGSQGASLAALATNPVPTTPAATSSEAAGDQLGYLQQGMQAEDLLQPQRDNFA